MYKRYLRLEATDYETGDVLFETEEHRVTFELDIGLAQGIATARVQIFNLSAEESKILMRGDFEPISEQQATDNRDMKRVRVRLYAGYLDEKIKDGKEPQLILEGYVMNATAVRKLPEHITNLYIIAYGSNLLMQKFESFTTPGINAGKKMTLKEVILKLCTSAGYEASKIDFSLMTDAVLDAEIVGQTFLNEDGGLRAALDQLMTQHQFYYGTRANGLGIYPRLKDSKQDSSEYNYLADNGTHLIINPINVKDTPIAGMASLEIKHTLDAQLFPGIVLDVGAPGSIQDEGIVDYSHVGKEIFYKDDVAKYAVLQYYMIKRVIHVGDTHGADWHSTLICTIPSTGITADQETE